MARADDRWWVVNPGRPWVGLGAILRAYATEVAAYDDRWAARASAQQLVARDRVRRNWAVLDRLRSAGGNR